MSGDQRRLIAGAWVGIDVVGFAFLFVWGSKFWALVFLVLLAVLLVVFLRVTHPAGTAKPTIDIFFEDAPSLPPDVAARVGLAPAPLPDVSEPPAVVVLAPPSAPREQPPPPPAAPPAPLASAVVTTLEEIEFAAKARAQFEARARGETLRGPDAAEPEVAEPEVAEPEVAEPEVAEPEVAGTATGDRRVDEAFPAPPAVVVDEAATTTQPALAEPMERAAPTTRTVPDLAPDHAPDPGQQPKLDLAPQPGQVTELERPPGLFVVAPIIDEDAVTDHVGILQVSTVAAIVDERSEDAKRRQIYLLNKIRLELDEYE